MVARNNSNAGPADGVAQILASFGSGAGVTEPTPPISPLPDSPRPGDEGFDVMAAIAVTLGSLDRHMGTIAAGAGRRRRPTLPYEAVHPLPLPAVSLGGAGTADPTSLIGPRTGWAWDIRRLTVVFGAGTTQVSIYSTAVDNSTLIAQLSASGIFSGNNEIMLHGERLVVVSAGGGFTMNGRVVEIAMPWLAEYLL
jgi:hypothetical protein